MLDILLSMGRFQRLPKMRISLDLIYIKLSRIGQLQPFYDKPGGNFLGYVTICPGCFIKLLIAPHRYSFAGNLKQGTFEIDEEVGCPECGWTSYFVDNMMHYNKAKTDEERAKRMIIKPKPVLIPVKVPEGLGEVRYAQARRIG
jgi:hypothetical protein